MKVVQMAYQNAQKSRQDVESPENLIVTELRDSALEDEAVLLEKMMADRDAISKRCVRQADDADAKHTLALVEAIISESARQAEELQDLVRRVEDPLLKSPKGAAVKIDEVRGNLTKAYQAVADTRSRIRRGERLDKVDFLADEQTIIGMNLEVLTQRLSNETAISNRIDERLHPEIESRIVEDDRSSQADEPTVEESETN